MTSGHDTGRRVSELILCPKFEEPRTMAHDPRQELTGPSVRCHRECICVHCLLGALRE